MGIGYHSNMLDEMCKSNLGCDDCARRYRTVKVIESFKTGLKLTAPVNIINIC